jgi:hypothetical protein
MYVLGSIYIYNRHTYIHIFICIKIVHLGSSAGRLSKLLSFLIQSI